MVFAELQSQTAFPYLLCIVKSRKTLYFAFNFVTYRAGSIIYFLFVKVIRVKKLSLVRSGSM